MEFNTPNGTKVEWCENEPDVLSIMVWQGYSRERGEAETVKRIFFRVDSEKRTIKATRAEIRHYREYWQGVIEAKLILSNPMHRAVTKAVAAKYGKGYFRLV
jgi:hypothetical protein